MEKPLILEADRLLVYARIAELEQKIIDLGPEIEEAVTQSSETWHDNAAFEVLRDQRTSYTSDIRELRRVLVSSTKQMPPKRTGVVGVDATVDLLNNVTKRRSKYYLAGDWTLRAGQAYQGALIISRQSPLGALLDGKKVGDSIDLNGAKFTIASVQ